MTAVNTAEVADLPYHKWKGPFIWTEGIIADLWGELKSHSSQTTDHKIWEIYEGGSTVSACLRITEIDLSSIWVRVCKMEKLRRCWRNVWRGSVKAGVDSDWCEWRWGLTYQRKNDLRRKLFFFFLNHVSSHFITLHVHTPWAHSHKLFWHSAVFKKRKRCQHTSPLLDTHIHTTTVLPLSS